MGANRPGAGLTARPKPQPPPCWGCGNPAPRITHVGAAGWYSRLTRFGGVAVSEIYCPDCFRLAGWPPLAGGWVLAAGKEGRA